ncbi:hypothetical protein C1645_771876, partial [Glomus cerebriforme]
MVLRGGRGRFPQFRGRGRRPRYGRDTQHDMSFDDNNDYQIDNYSGSSGTNAIMRGINDLHLGNVVDKTDINEDPSPTPSISSPAPAVQPPKAQRHRTKRPGWTIEEEVKLINYVCNNYELLSNNKKLFWREFGKNSEQTLHYPRSADSCKTKFHSLIARYHQNVDFFDAVERYLDLEEGLVSPRRVPLLKRVSRSIEEEQESLSTTSARSAKHDIPLLKIPQSTSSQAVVLDQDSREMSILLPRDTSNAKSDDGHVSGTTSPINNPSSLILESAVAIVPKNAVSSCNYTTSDSSRPYNDFPSFIKSIRQQIVVAQDYLNREKSRAEDHINSLDSVLYLFTQLEDQLQRM